MAFLIYPVTGGARRLTGTGFTIGDVGPDRGSSRVDQTS